MPFKSEAQRRKFAQLVIDKKLGQSVFDEWDAATPKGIPERMAKQGPRVARRVPTPLQLRSGKRS